MKTGTKLGILALVVALACAALWSYQMRQVDIPENRAAFAVVFLSAAALGVAALVKGAGWLGGIPAAFAILIGSFLPFTMAISHQQVAAHGIEVGETIPHFTALDDKGKRFDSDSLRGHPVLIKFFRAHW
jgi:cytochrome oxidase Cu insertion factor (SCO1/SenC/PrrC family)